MEFVKNFISEYGMVIVYTLLTALATAVATFIKNKYKEKCDTKAKKEIVKQCVLMAEQVYKALDGEEKKTKAIESITAMLDEKGIHITPLEMEVLIEACIGEFNGVFNETESEDTNVVSETEKLYNTIFSVE